MTFICEYCNTNFSRKGNLKRHINSIHELINFRCERCEFTTTHKDKLREHIISKHYQKIFKCLKCSAEFIRNDNLARHMKNHVDLSIRVLEQLCKDINSGKDETSIYKCKDTHSDGLDESHKPLTADELWKKIYEIIRVLDPKKRFW